MSRSKSGPAWDATEGSATRVPGVLMNRPAQSLGSDAPATPSIRMYAGRIYSDAVNLLSVARHIHGALICEPSDSCIGSEKASAAISSLDETLHAACEMMGELSRELERIRQVIGE